LSINRYSKNQKTTFQKLFLSSRVGISLCSPEDRSTQFPKHYFPIFGIPDNEQYRNPVILRDIGHTFNHCKNDFASHCTQSLLKSKAILITGLGGLQGYKMLRIQHCPVLSNVCYILYHQFKSRQGQHPDRLWSPPSLSNG
jgi:hypothetical protein